MNIDEYRVRLWFPEKQEMVYDACIHVDGDNVHVSWRHLSAELNDNIIPMRCTGRRDNNGNLVYGGDILSSFVGVSIVKYIPGVSASWWLRFSDMFSLSFSHLDGNEFELIGNIYENPELIGEW